jgi:membrane protease subunit (stomatin/prohibitin family)
MFRRRPLLRAAVVGGGAYMAGKHMARRQDEQGYQDAQQDARLSDLEQQQAPAQQAQQARPAAAPQASASSPMIDQLNQLAALHQQGVLTDDEFTAAKAKLFGT